jgi:hypothetical protein
MLKNIDFKYKIAIIVSMVLIFVCVAFWVYGKVFTPKVTKIPNVDSQNKAITLPIETRFKQITSVGIEAKNPGDADIQVSSKSNYVVEVNGKKEELQPVVKETSKLENNKVVVTQENTVTTKIKLPEPAGSFGAGMNDKDELAIMADGRIYKNLNWWVYASRSEQAVGAKVTIYK